MQILGNKIALYRMKQGLSLRELSKISGISITTISFIERDLSKPHPKTAYKLCEALGVTFEDIFLLDNPAKQEE